MTRSGAIKYLPPVSPTALPGKGRVRDGRVPQLLHDQSPSSSGLCGHPLQYGLPRLRRTLQCSKLRMVFAHLAACPVRHYRVLPHLRLLLHLRLLKPREQRLRRFAQCILVRIVSMAPKAPLQPQRIARHRPAFQPLPMVKGLVHQPSADHRLIQPQGLARIAAFKAVPRKRQKASIERQGAPRIAQPPQVHPHTVPEGIGKLAKILRQQSPFCRAHGARPEQPPAASVYERLHLHTCDCGIGCRFAMPWLRHAPAYLPALTHCIGIAHAAPPHGALQHFLPDLVHAYLLVNTDSLRTNKLDTEYINTKTSIYTSAI